MKKKVLVYDNQLGYYQLLNETLKSGSYDFQLFDNTENDYKNRYDAVVFFLHDDIELLDMAKLYNPQTPFVLGMSKNSKDGTSAKENMFTVDLNQTRNGIEKKFIEVFDTLV